MRREIRSVLADMPRLETEHDIMKHGAPEALGQGHQPPDERVKVPS